MKRVIHNFDSPERFVAGTVGLPGERTFFLQASSGNKVTSVVLEKAQVFAIAERITFMLKELKRNQLSLALEILPLDERPLEMPILEEFRVGIMSLSWLSDREKVLLQLQALTENVPENDELIEDDVEDAPDLLRVLISAGQAQSFAQRAISLVNAGREPCAFCGLPLDPTGHVCPRANGYRR